MGQKKCPFQMYDLDGNLLDRHMQISKTKLNTYDLYFKDQTLISNMFRLIQVTPSGV